MKLVIVSGLSGSGKTVALNTLEDAGFFCVDNLPIELLPKFIDTMVNSKPPLYDLTAVAIDARSGVDDLDHFENIIGQLRSIDFMIEILFLTADNSQLLSRFSETRRKHPLSRPDLPLVDAINLERDLLKNINANADLIIDTSTLKVHELRQTIVERLLPNTGTTLAILIQSFGFKHGLPADSDFVFDVRCLPNPHWEERLKPLTGRDASVIAYLENIEEVNAMFQSISEFLKTWLPCIKKENRSYMTVSIGCTGGQHRSVYLVEKIAGELLQQRYNTSVRHRDIS